MKQFGIREVDDRKKMRGVGVNNACGVGIGALWVFGCLMPLMPVNAGPSTSPSARAAARFKHHPPAGWIRHYLPDDRYKIKGGSWKYVSTELDTYYHRPDSALMLRQSPNGVIGFSSAADAEEAGYRPAPNTNPDYSRFSYDPKPEAVVPTANMSAPGGAGAMGAAGAAGNPMAGLGSMGDLMSKGGSLAMTVNGTGKPRRVALGDGVSTVVLPPGWGRALIPAEMLGTAGTEAQKMGLQVDLLRPPGNNEKRGGIVMVSLSFPDMPPGFDMSMIFNPRYFQRGGASGRSRSGRVMSRTSNPMTAGLGMGDVRPATLGGLRGMSITPQTAQGARQLGFRGTLTMTGRGNKLYMMAMEGLSRRTPGVSTVLNSYRPR